MSGMAPTVSAQARSLLPQGGRLLAAQAWQAKPFARARKRKRGSLGRGSRKPSRLCVAVRPLRTVTPQRGTPVACRASPAGRRRAAAQPHAEPTQREPPTQSRAGCSGTLPHAEATQRYALNSIARWVQRHAAGLSRCRRWSIRDGCRRTRRQGEPGSGCLRCG